MQACISARGCPFPNHFVIITTAVCSSNSEAEKKAEEAKISFDDEDDKNAVNVEESCSSGLMPDPTGPPFGIVLNGHALVSQPPKLGSRQLKPAAPHEFPTSCLALLLE